MILSKEQKAQQIEEIADHLKSDKAVLLVNYQGLKVGVLEDLRQKLRENNESFRIVKNTLFGLALKKVGKKVEQTILDQPIGLVFSADDEVTPSKITYEIAKDNENLKILGGFIGGVFVTPDVINNLAKLPGREELYTKLVGSLSAPISGMVNVLRANLFGLVSVLRQHERSLNG